MNRHAHHGTPETHHAHGGGLPGGLLISQDGYTLAPESTVLRPGPAEIRFRVLGPDGRPVTAFTEIHDKKVHLIIARRELTGFWHLHPEHLGEGLWSARLDLPEAGAYRIFTDISPEGLGRTLTLGADLAVAGPYEPLPVPEPATVFTVDGYEVRLDGEPAHGEGRHLTFTVAKDGRPVTDLQPYLAAYGHLVVLRAGDLAYVHVHPGGEPGDGVTEPGPGIGFHVELPGPGTYRFFLDFKHGDVVRTAAFTAVAR
ncbi:hypothetical protein [Thermomonospora umbrina]|uniref:Secreted protein n=1 Tax=Thermomonospora umbrina TaxID=111806 RepID=A0A3D9STX5_9ACTN|nr:hypothetical protein [Thermomonospora umbrina]REE96435.1 hypothetical protein DFJ69_1871 [Thermomonospora umbrina]